jgi:oxygen-dependent protoporphyrinogen oxidase
MPGTIVIGAGVTGLAAANELDRAGAEFVVLEATAEAGGAMRSHAADGFLFEDGPSSVLDTNDAFAGLCAALGLSGEIVDAGPAAKERWIWKGGELVPIPSAPTALMTTPLLGFTERLRFMKEAFVAPAAPGVEESVAAFVERRFGRGAARYAGAVVSGIYAGDPVRLSLDAAFPEVRKIEREHGSLLKGAAAGPRKGKRLQSLRGGLGAVPAACRARLGPRLRLGTAVRSLARSDDGRIAVATEAGGATGQLVADAVIVATPAAAAAALVRPLAAEAADSLAAIESASLAVVQLGLGPEASRAVPEGFGFLVPRDEGLESLGWVFLSRIFEGRSPPDCAAITGFFGGLLAPKALALSDQDLGALAVREIGSVLGSDLRAGVRMLRIVRWKSALPQYDLGHARRVERALGALGRAAPRVVLAGNWLGGISVPSSIASGQAAARAARERGGAET